LITIGKKVSGTFCEELALRVLCTKGSGHFFTARSLAEMIAKTDEVSESQGSSAGGVDDDNEHRFAEHEQEGEQEGRASRDGG
jgi:hypothetical protein